MCPIFSHILSHHCNYLISFIITLKVRTVILTFKMINIINNLEDSLIFQNSHTPPEAKPPADHTEHIVSEKRPPYCLTYLNINIDILKANICGLILISTY